MPRFHGNYASVRIFSEVFTMHGFTSKDYCMLFQLLSVVVGYQQRLITAEQETHVHTMVHHMCSTLSLLRRPSLLKKHRDQLQAHFIAIALELRTFWHVWKPSQMTCVSTLVTLLATLPMLGSVLVSPGLLSPCRWQLQ